MVGGSAGSSSANTYRNLALVAHRSAARSKDSLAMTPINVAHIAEKLGPSSPNMITKAIKTLVLVAKPHRKRQDNAEPRQESVITERRGQRSVK